MKNGAVYNVTCEGKKELFFSPSKVKGNDARTQVNLYNDVINQKRIWYQSYFFLFQLLQVSFRRSKKKIGRTLRKNNSTILTPRSSTCLLRNRKPGTLYLARTLSDL